MKMPFNFIKNAKKRSKKIYTYLTAILVVVFFASFVGQALSSQIGLKPENPIKQAANNSSKISLVGNYKNLLNVTDNEGTDSQQEKKQQEKTKQQSNKPITNDTKNQEQPTEQTTQPIEKDHSDSDGNKGATGNGSTENGDNDSNNIELEDNSDGENQNSYFTTSIVNNEIVTKENYSFFIKQKEHSYIVDRVEVFLNNKLESEFDGNVTLREDKNQIKVQVTYKDQDGKVFTVSKKYTVHYKPNKMIIYASLQSTMEVTKADLTFTASAEKDGKKYPVTVVLDGKEIKESSKQNYEVQLKDGKNNILISATDNANKKTDAQYAIFYKPTKSSLKIITDLKDQQVVNPSLQFNAIAKDDSGTVDLFVTANDELIEGNGQGNYSITLNDGENIVVLQASKEEDVLTQEYVVTYSKPTGGEDDDVDKDKNAPTIETDLIDGSEFTGTIKTFNVMPKDYKGNRIRGSHVAVTNNGVGVGYTWDDSTKTSYKLNLKDGKNEVIIRVWDDEGRTTTKTFYIYATAVEDGGVIGKATISIEATTIGLGYLIPPTVVDIHQGEKTSIILNQLLTDNGFTYEHTGRIDNSFYLGAIGKPGLVTNPSIPNDLKELVSEASTRFDENDYDPNWLGEFDFANGSGWMYSVNGDYPNYGFADSYLLDGDVVRIRYTLHYGKDIGGFGSMGGGEGNNWYKEW